MKCAHYVGLAALSAALVVIAQTALADGPPVSTEQREQASAHYQRGTEAYRAGRYREAIEEFHEADRIEPSPALSFNVALAYEELGETARALEHYRKYLRRAPNAEELALVEQRIDELDAILVGLGLQQVTVASSPPGASLSVDGTPRGATPWTGELALGEHRLVATREDHQTREIVFQLTAEAALDVAVELSPVPEAPPRAVPLPIPATTSAVNPGSAVPGREPTPESDGMAPRWSFIVLGAGAASLLGAGVFEFMRQQEEEAAESARYQLDYQDAYERQETRQTTARVLLGLGGALAVTGGVLLWVESRPEHSPSASVSCGVGGCYGVLRRAF